MRFIESAARIGIEFFLVAKTSYWVGKTEPSPRPVKVDFLYRRDKRVERLSPQVIARACVFGSQRNRLQIISDRQEETWSCLTRDSIKERLVSSGADESVARKMVGSLKVGQEVSLISGRASEGLFFTAIVDRPKSQTEPAVGPKIPYLLNVTAWHSRKEEELLRKPQAPVH